MGRPFLLLVTESRSFRHPILGDGHVPSDTTSESRTPDMTRRTILSAAFAALAAAAPAAAQTDSLVQLEPYVGAFTDAYDISPDGSNAGIAAGLRLAFPVSDQFRAVGNLGYAKSHDVSNPSGLTSYWVYDNQWAMTTVGAEVDAIVGRTTIALGLQGGAGWRRIDLAGKVGDPTDVSEVYGGSGFTPMDVIVPEVSIRYRVTDRTSIRLGVQDQIFDVLEGPAEHSPSFSVGLSLR